MYCKYCGKQIDDDSKFCKHCGSFLGVTINIPRNYECLLKNNFVLIALIVIWYIIGYLDSSEYLYEEDSRIVFCMYLMTPMIVGVLYWIYIHKCKYPIKLFDRADTIMIKLLKYGYLAYTYFIPFFCSEVSGSDYSYYFFILSLVWLVPTLIACAVFYYIQSEKQLKKITN